MFSKELAAEWVDDTRLSDDITDEAWLEDLAHFVVNLGFTPDEYWNLTTPERNAIVKVANKRKY